MAIDRTDTNIRELRNAGAGVNYCVDCRDWVKPSYTEQRGHFCPKCGLSLHMRRCSRTLLLQPCGDRRCECCAPIYQHHTQF